MKYFKPEDFAYTYTDEEKSDEANAKLQKLIEASPVVYGTKNQFDIKPFASKHDKLQARLMFITELPKSECKHEPNLLSQKIGGWFCKHCDVSLVAEWKESK